MIPDLSPCNDTPDKHRRYVLPMNATQTLDYEHPYSLVPGASTKLAPRAERQVLGPLAWPGEQTFHDVWFRFGGLHRFSAKPRGGYFPERGRCDQPLTSVSPPSLQFSVSDTPSRELSWARGAKISSHRRPVTGGDFPDRGCLPSTRTISRKR